MQKIFVAMPISPEFDDVLDSIRTVGKSVGIDVVRIDQQESNEKISDRIITEIQSAEYIIADLTESRPNVFFEAGYALGIGKSVIFIAKNGTKLEFDIHDYPVIFYRQFVELRARLEKRLADVLPFSPQRQRAPRPKASTPNLDDQDIKARLTGWVQMRMTAEKGCLQPIEYATVDSELGLVDGSTKKFIADVVTNKWGYDVEHAGANTISFKTRPLPRARPRMIGGFNLDGF